MLYDQAAEENILGSMLMDNDALLLAAHSLTPEDFYIPSNKAFFEAALYRLKQGISVDVVTIKNRLEELGIFEKIGGAAYLKSIAGAVGSSVHVKSWIELVCQMSQRRRYFMLAEQLKELAQSGEYTALLDCVDSLEEKQRRSPEDMARVRDIVESLLEQAIKQKKNGGKGGPTGLKTGFVDLDAYTGGLQENNLIILAARPAMGKTAFALDLVRGAARHTENKVIAIFSLEMTKEQIAKRLCAADLKITNDAFKLFCFQDRELKNMEEGIESLESMTSRLYIDDSESLTPKQMYTRCHTLKAKTGKELAFIMVDYLQLITGDKSGNREQEIAGISREMKKMAKKFRCPVLLLSQLSRACEQRPNKRPLLSDLRESGAIEQDADMVLFLYREEYYHPETQRQGQAELIIGKHRDGAIGTIQLGFSKTLTTFRSLDKGYLV